MFSFECRNNRDETLRGSIHMPDGEQRFPALIMCHGFSGSRNGFNGVFVELGRRLAASGIMVVRFDFAGSGESDGRFVDMTLSREIEDLEAVLAYVRTLPRVDPERIVLGGTSMGAVVAGMTAGRHPQRVNSLCMWAPAAVIPDDARSGRLQHIQLDPEDLPDYVDFKGLSVGRPFFEDAEQQDIYGETAAFKGPVLVLHGQQDNIVPLEYAHRYLQYCPQAIVEEIPAAGHSFDSLEARQRLLQETETFLRGRVI